MGLMSELKKNIKGKAAELNEKIEKTLEAVDEGLDNLKELKAEEKQKLEQMGLEAYTKNLKEDKDVYGDISEKTITKIEKIYTKIEGLEEKHTSRLVGEGTLYGLGVHFRRKMLLNNKKNIGGK